MAIALARSSPARRPRPAVVLLVAALAAIAAAVGLVRAERGDDPTSPAAVRRAATSGFAPLEERIDVLERRVVPGDADYLSTLGLRLMGADAQWTFLLIGILIIAAVAVDQWIRKVSS